MKIVIRDQRKIVEVQKVFNSKFPFLKIEFFNTPHNPGRPSLKIQLLSPLKTLGECRSFHTTGTLLINPGMTVSELEQNFQNNYGLSVQIFRKSGKVWLETTVTDGWTLAEQNKEGEELSAKPNNELV